MALLQGLFWLWVWYIWLRFLLSFRHVLEMLHWTMVEMPIWTMGTVHSYTLYAIFLIWSWVHTTLYFLEHYLRFDTYAEEFFWIPDIEYNPLGYS